MSSHTLPNGCTCGSSVGVCKLHGGALPVQHAGSIDHPSEPVSALVVCEVCGMPVRVLFDKAGEIEKVLAPCGHPVKEETPDAD